MNRHKIGASPTIEFFGGVGEVTGSCYLVSYEDTKILIDCGMFQGSEAMDVMNRKDFQFDPKSIDAVFITHAHIDHIGRLPKLVKSGFHGAIYSTLPTKELSELLLADSLHFMKDPDEALYNEDDIKKTISLWKSLEYHQETQVGSYSVSLRDAGHILGSSMIHIKAGQKQILFSGDFGNSPSILLPPPEEMPDGIEYLVIESTYGNRIHDVSEDRALKLERAIEDVVTNGGVLMIPAFATERTQDILYKLNEMVMHSRIPKIPIFVDSPLAIKATAVFNKFRNHYNADVQEAMRKDPEIFNFKGLKFTSTVDESKAINDVPPPKVILAGSGMSTGGRILHHELRYLPDPRSMLLLVGYQSGGSLGRRLSDGASEVKILKEMVAVRAEIRKVAGFSAHADGPQLFNFVKRGRASLKRVFVVQGENEAAAALAQEVKDQLGVTAETPSLYEKVVLE